MSHAVTYAATLIPVPFGLQAFPMSMSSLGTIVTHPFLERRDSNSVYCARHGLQTSTRRSIVAITRRVALTATAPARPVAPAPLLRAGRSRMARYVAVEAHFARKVASLGRMVG